MRRALARVGRGLLWVAALPFIPGFLATLGIQHAMEALDRWEEQPCRKTDS